MNYKIKVFCLLLIVTTFSCTEQAIEMNSTDSTSTQLKFNKVEMEKFSLDLSNNIHTANKNSSSQAEMFMSAVNKELMNQELPIQLNVIEYYSLDESGNTIFFNNRGKKQISSDFVSGDPRRGGSTAIFYATDGIEATTSSGLTKVNTDNAILSAMTTWDNVSCSTGLNLNYLGSVPFDLGYVQFLVSGGANGSNLFTDLMHSGFNTSVFNAIFGPGSNVLGVTFTFVWGDTIDGVFTPTDVDNNGKDDTAFRDIYYNDSYSWTTDASGNSSPNIDVETVALHEAGHGLSQGHFGTAFFNNGGVHFAPRAVMNATYSGIQTTIEKTDKAGHCSNWAQWPYN